MACMKRPLNEYEHFKFAVSVCKNACKLLTKHRNTPLAKRKEVWIGEQIRSSGKPENLHGNLWRLEQLQMSSSVLSWKLTLSPFSVYKNDPQKCAITLLCKHYFSMYIFMKPSSSSYVVFFVQKIMHFKCWALEELCAWSETWDMQNWSWHFL